MALKNEIETLQRRLQEHNDFIEAIRHAPDDEALAIVHRLRSSEDLAAVLSSYQGRPGSSSQLSEHASVRAVMPSTETGIEFELVTHPPTAYSVLVPQSPSSIASSSLVGGYTENTPPSGTRMSLSGPHMYCDYRLELLSVSYWTRIPIDNGLAARLISHFLRTDHPVLGFFDADLFVHDLVEQGLSFCSSFLFHSVMSVACVCLHFTLFRKAF